MLILVAISNQISATLLFLIISLNILLKYQSLMKGLTNIFELNYNIQVLM